MNIDFPLILLILVSGSGLIWALDALFAAGPRRARIADLQRRYPKWEQDDAGDAKKYRSSFAETASEPVIVEYARSFFPLLAFVFVLRSFLFEPFQIPSSSMVPTLEVGDFILVNKFNYGLRLPVARSQVVPIGKPERGDVMVFFPPHQNDTYYIKRVIGIPGDRIEYRGKAITVNGEPVPREWLATVPEGRSRYDVGLESVGSDRYLMQIDQRRPSRDFSATVKAGHYFMMAVYVKNSANSRGGGQCQDEVMSGKPMRTGILWRPRFGYPFSGVPDSAT